MLTTLSLLASPALIRPISTWVVGAPVGVSVPVGVGVTNITWITWSVYRARLLTTLLLLSTISLSRVMGAGGENCQWIRASPSPTAQKATWATRKSPEQPLGQFESAPEA